MRVLLVAPCVLFMEGWISPLPFKVVGFVCRPELVFGGKSFNSRDPYCVFVSVYTWWLSFPELVSQWKSFHHVPKFALNLAVDVAEQ